MKKVTLAALALTAAMSTQARANYAWEFEITKVVPGNVNYSPPPFGFIPDPSVKPKDAKSWVSDMVLTITNQAFASRSLSIEWAGCNAGCQIPPHGDLAGFVSLTGNYLAPPGGWGSGLFDLTWNKRGKISGDVELEGDVSDLSMTSSGTGNQWTGMFLSDASECGMSGDQECEVTFRSKFLGDPPAGGTSVPEPASMGLLAAGLLGLGMVRRRTV